MPTWRRGAVAYTGEARAGDTVAVAGVGGIGINAVQGADTAFQDELLNYCASLTGTALPAQAMPTG